MKKVIEISCLITLAIVITASMDYRMSVGQSPSSNTTTTNPSITTQQTQGQPIIPFTFPSNNQDEAAGPANTGVSGSGSSSSGDGKQQASDDIVLLSQGYISGEAFDKIAGEILNNGSGTAEFVNVTVSFYDDDDDGATLGSETTYAYPSTINPGDKSPFNVFVTDNAVKDAAGTYDFTIQWRDTNGTDQSVQIAGYPAQDSESSSDNDNKDIIVNELIRSMVTERE